MSCHYSCSACSSDTYFDQCTSCPFTRQAIGSTCACISGYFDRQQQTCLSSQNLQNWEKSLSQINEILFYIAIVFSWMGVFLTMTRIMNPKFKRVIDFIQILALVSFYRFPYNTVALGALRVLSAYNFNYFSELLCTKQGPPTYCLIYQNILAPLICLAGFVIIYLITFLIMKVFLYVQWIVYFKRSIWGFAFWYLDYTIIYNSVIIMRTIHSSYWAFFIVGAFLLFLIAMLVKFYKIINDKEQIFLSHRVTNSYLYLYDENYHLYYIDYLLDSENVAKHQENDSIMSSYMPTFQRKNNLHNSMSKYVSRVKNLRGGFSTNRVQNAQPLQNGNELQRSDYKQDQKQDQKQKEQKSFLFFPKSNFLLFQLLFKCVSAVIVVLLYDFKPLFFTYLLVVALVVQLVNLQVHFYYERADIVTFIVFMVIYLFTISNYWNKYFTYIIFCVMLLSQIIICAYIIIMAFTGCIKRSLLQKVYKKQQEPDEIEQQKQKVKQNSQQNQKNHPSDLIVFQQADIQNTSSEQTINPFGTRKTIKSLRKRKTNKSYFKRITSNMVRQTSELPLQENQQPEN